MGWLNMKDKIEIIKEYILANWKVHLPYIIGLVVLLCIVAFMWYRHEHTTAELEKAKTLTTEQATDLNSLQNKLDLSQGAAEQLRAEIVKAQQNKVTPTTSFTVISSTHQKAAESVTERINKNDSTLPPAALEKTDRTVVTPQPDNKDYQVGVYKIDLRKDNRIKAGVAVVDSKVYPTVGFEKGRAEVLIHFSGVSKVEGATVLYNVAEW